MKIDNIDRKILRMLQENSKITNAYLSKKIGLSPAPTLERVRKLEKKGIISGYHAQLNLSEIGLGVSTFVLVSLKEHNKKNLAFWYVKSELSKEELAKKDLFIEVEKKKYLASIILEPLNNKNIREI